MNVLFGYLGKKDLTLNIKFKHAIMGICVTISVADMRFITDEGRLRIVASSSATNRFIGQWI